MDMTGEHRIPAPRDAVWAALNDPAVLRASIPGCEELNQVSPTELTAKVTAKIGPVKQRFNGDVFLEDVNPPESYTLKGEGKGTAGFAKGGAKVALAEDGGETVLRYEAHADIGGKLAQLGSRLVHGTAKKMADEFFTNFARHVTSAHEPAGAVPAAPPAEPEAAPAAAAPAPATATGPEPAAAPEPAAPMEGVPKRAAAAAEAAARVTAERAAQVGGSAAPLWQRPIVWAAVAAVVVLLLFLS